ncbi:MAG: D-alanine--D-alanine ligase [Bacteroides sp.]|nr:D-alanine--D-alanine ligase [Eubacterium sp.]MCM1419008.1 D-alanine--D-alanine ligase [Roseburia sp.]MCM1462870.1 D-alanine--D-alanine ligase [Bacteroides sp.]
MKIRVGVFFGGKSVEHEVSVITGLQACGAMDKEKYEVVPVYITKDNRFYIGEEIGKIAAYRDLKALLAKSARVIPINDGGLKLLRYPMKKFGENVLAALDVVFPAVHGTNVEDGAFQGFLQTLGVPYASCDVLSSAVGMDKYVMKTVFADHGVPVLPCVVTNVKRYTRSPEETLAAIEAKTRYPVIVKPINLGSSVGIRKAKDREELTEALEYAFTFSIRVLVENALEHIREINCAVLGDYESAEASECEEPLANDEILSYQDKYIGGGKGMASLKRKIPAEIDPERREEIRSLAVKAFQALGCCGVARVDFMLDEDGGRLYLTEINTIPGSLSFYLWEPLGMKYPELLDHMISLAFKREREQKALSFSFETNLLESASLGGSKGSKGKA